MKGSCRPAGANSVYNPISKDMASRLKEPPRKGNKKNNYLLAVIKKEEKM
ncbi:hypothetical protein WCP94_001169 [Bilophila wadsworthia]